MWLLLFVSLAPAGGDPALLDAARFVDDPAELEALTVHLDTRAAEVATSLAGRGEVSASTVREVLGTRIAESLAEKKAMDEAQPFGLDTEGIRRRVIDYEAFKLQTYVTSGVFPKRYFGYFDLAWDTAEHERTLRETTRCTTRVINDYQAEAGSPVRVNDAEIAVTFIAEGGALLLREDQHRMNDLHLVYDVGLDDVAKGSESYPGLIGKLDADCGTDLGSIVVYTEPGAKAPPGSVDRVPSNDGRWGWLVRKATFEEAIVGTAMMWIWEKEIAARKLIERGSKPVHQRDLADQFIVGSLVYNSGIPHNETTLGKVREFATGEYLFERSEANAHRRPRLNLLRPPELLVELLTARSYREQPTSWVAVYHVLQRYGAWEALRRFTDVFDDEGMFTVTEPR